MQITEQTRKESFISLDRQTRYRQILNTLQDNEMTARQICYKLGYYDLNAVKPRLTELVHANKVTVTGKKKDSVTGKNVAVYKAVG